MNLNRDDVIRLRKELIPQLVQFIEDYSADHQGHIEITRTSRDFWFNDKKEPGKHTKDHGQRLSEEFIDYLFRQADDIFDENFDEKTGKSFWIKKEQPATSADQQEIK